MNGSSALSAHFQSGAFLHPLDPEIPNSVDLVRAIAHSASNPAVSAMPGMTPHVDGLSREIVPADHLIFVLIDGLGIPILEAHLDAKGFLRSGFRRELRAVFPSTTTVALTSLASGAWPGTHGLTGWWTHFPDASSTIAVLPFRERFTNRDMHKAGAAANALIYSEALWGGSERETHIVLPRSIKGGSYNEWFNAGARSGSSVRSRTLGKHIRKLIRASNGPTLTYVYLPQVDSTSHKFGPYSEEVAAVTRETERLCEQVLRQARAASRGSVSMILTADHGQIATPPQRELLIRHDDEVSEYFRVPPSGDARASQLWLRRDRPVSEQLPEIENLLRKALERIPGPRGDFALVETDELIRDGLLGPVDITPEVRTRWGDAVLLSLGDLAIEYVAEDGSFHGFQGNHSGLSPEEMRVPLIIH
ncbi:MAG: alkaline phosphatase family protein [bacterium]